MTVAGGGESQSFTFDHAATFNSSTLSLAPDGSGNVDLVLDSTPAIAFTTLNNLTTNQASYIVNGTVDVAIDPYAIGTTVDVLENNNVVGTGTVGANGYWQANVALADTDGANSLTATDTDLAGNTATTGSALKLTANTTAAAFTPGNLVISISGDGDGSGVYGDNQASPMVLEQITTSGTIVSQLVMSQGTDPVSSEYGSSSEGSIELSADGHSLTIAGYGINAATFNEGGAAVYGNAALAQSTSIDGGQYTPVARVIADIAADGDVSTTDVASGIYNVNNPRSVVTIDGSTYWISGQGDKNATGVDQGVFSVDGSTDTGIFTSTDTRDLEIYNNTLYVSVDSSQSLSAKFMLLNKVF